jgi:hypothetical protein
MFLERQCFSVYKGRKEQMSKTHDTVNCLNCDKVIALFVDDTMAPTPEQCYESGNVPVPNCGWFCSQECVNQFGIKHDLRFDRTANGLVDYYGKLT